MRANSREKLSTERGHQVKARGMVVQRGGSSRGRWGCGADVIARGESRAPRGESGYFYSFMDKSDSMNSTAATGWARGDFG